MTVQTLPKPHPTTVENGGHYKATCSRCGQSTDSGSHNPPCWCGSGAHAPCNHRATPNMATQPGTRQVSVGDDEHRMITCGRCGTTYSSSESGYHTPPCFCGDSGHAACNRPHP